MLKKANSRRSECVPLTPTRSVSILVQPPESGRRTAVGRAIRTHQHRGSQVELLEELRDEAVCLDDVTLLAVLDVAQDVHHPLVALVAGGRPNEVELQHDPHDRSRLGSGLGIG